MGVSNVIPKFANPHTMTEIAVPWARAVVGNISVGMSQIVASQPMPKAPVARKRVIVPRVAGRMWGIGIGRREEEEWFARKEKRVRRKKEVVRMREPLRRRVRRPRASMRSQARVMRAK